MAEYEQAVFISYAWGSERESIVNEIDESLQQRGIRIIRDKRVLGYKGSIRDFMERIGQGHCVIVVISDKYLRSPNCMFELVEIAENKQFHDRVFPVVLSDANIYDPVTRLEYVKHWEAKRKELAKAMKGVDPANLHGIREDMDQYDRIRDKISGITSILKDMNTLTPDMHRDSEFSNLYDAIMKRMGDVATDVTAEFSEIAKKADRGAKADDDGKTKEGRESKEEADRLAAQKAAEERLAQAKIVADRKAEEEAVGVASQKAEADRKAKEEADRLAAQAKAAPVQAKPVATATTQKKPASRGLVIGIVAVVVLCIAGIIGISALSKGGGAATDISGVYIVNGTNHDGSTYTDTVTITKSDDSYNFTYGQSEQTVTGTFDGTDFTGRWEGQGQTGNITYRLQSDRSLSGTWTTDGQDGQGTEVLTPQ